MGELRDDGTGGLTGEIIGAAIEVHRRLGPGLLERTYQLCFRAELGYRGISVACQVPLPVTYRDIRLECGYRIDLLVEETVVVELKVVERLAPVHVSQVLTYLRFAELRVGLLFNFNVQALAAGGVKRVLLDRPTAGSPFDPFEPSWGS
jgi:GxxExxY protein